MFHRLLVCVALLALSSTIGCKSNAYSKLGESCGKDGDCITNAVCVTGHEGKKMCLQKCGTNALSQVKNPDCPDGWTCGAIAQKFVEKTGDRAYAGLADDPICVRPEWSLPQADTPP